MVPDPTQEDKWVVTNRSSALSTFQSGYEWQPAEDIMAMIRRAVNINVWFGKGSHAGRPKKKAISPNTRIELRGSARIRGYR